MPRPLTDTPAERIQKRISVSETGCWLWTSTVGGHGYGYVVWRDVPEQRAHRASWHIHRGPIPKGLLVCHRCDMPLCVNPDHLFLGTHRDNGRDASAKSRFNLALRSANGRRRALTGKRNRNGSAYFIAD